MIINYSSFTHGLATTIGSVTGAGMMHYKWKKAIEKDKVVIFNFTDKDYWSGNFNKITGKFKSIKLKPQYFYIPIYKSYQDDGLYRSLDKRITYHDGENVFPDEYKKLYEDSEDEDEDEDENDAKEDELKWDEVMEVGSGYLLFSSKNALRYLSTKFHKIEKKNNIFLLRVTSPDAEIIRPEGTLMCRTIYVHEWINIWDLDVWNNPRLYISENIPNLILHYCEKMSPSSFAKLMDKEHFEWNIVEKKVKEYGWNDKQKFRFLGKRGFPVTEFEIKNSCINEKYWISDLHLIQKLMKKNPLFLQFYTKWRTINEKDICYLLSFIDDISDPCKVPRLKLMGDYLLNERKFRSQELLVKLAKGRCYEIVNGYLTQDSIKTIIKFDPDSISDLKRHVSFEMERFAFDLNPDVFAFLSFQSSDICRKALKHNPINIWNVKNPTERMIMIAIREDFRIVEDFLGKNNITKKMYIEAAKNPDNLKYIKLACPEIIDQIMKQKTCSITCS